MHVCLLVHESARLVQHRYLGSGVWGSVCVCSVCQFRGPAGLSEIVCVSAFVCQT